MSYFVSGEMYNLNETIMEQSTVLHVTYHELNVKLEALSRAPTFPTDLDLRPWPSKI